MKNIRFFYLKIFIFLVVKFSMYLNRRVFVMRPKLHRQRQSYCNRRVVDKKRLLYNTYMPPNILALNIIRHIVPNLSNSTGIVSI